MNVRVSLPASPCVSFFLIVLASFAPSSGRGQDDRVYPEDYSKTNSVTLPLAEAKRNGPTGHGLKHAYWERDGRTTVLDVEGVPCRSLSLTEEGRAKGYFYFALDPTFKEQNVSKVKIDVEYFDGFDGQIGVFGLQYDATGATDGTGQSSKALLPNVPLKGSGKWLKATFHVRDGTFQNSQNARSDFRVVASPPELCVSRVTVTLESQAPAAEPLRFDADGQARLNEWNVQWDSGDKPAFSRHTGETKGTNWLEIRSPGTMSAGSWRTAVLLPAGEYEFVGRARTEGLEPGSDLAGVMLRASGMGGSRRVIHAADWMSITYGFTTIRTDYVELVCDFRGSQGSVRFDVDSLKLVRKGKTPRPEKPE